MKVRDAAANYIRAEYQFRQGKHSFTTQTQNWLLEAYDDLCEAVTGERDTVAAARELGVDVEADRPPKVRRTKGAAKRKKKGARLRKRVSNKN